MARKSIDKATVLETAVRLADRDGLEQVTLAALAQELGIKTPSLYNHINGMNGLRKELALLGLRKLKEQLIQAAIGMSGDQALFSIGSAYVAFVRKHPGLYEATFPSSSIMDENIEKAGAEIVELLLRVLGAYEFTEEDALHAVRGLRSIVHGFASLELKQSFGLPLDCDESLKRLLETYLRGLKNSG
ncbi:MAG: WHG domain-containing protein [Ectobacillus sp.]